MKYKNLHDIARQIDHSIDHHTHETGSSAISKTQIEQLVLRNYPDFYVQAIGWHKIVFALRSIDQKIVLKVGTKRRIENDHRAYKRVPEGLRHQFFARIYWHTKYCLLQEYGFPTEVTAEELTRIRKVVYRFGIIDVKAENLRRIGGQLKIIDSNFAILPAPMLLRVEEANPRLPKRLVHFAKKITRLLDD